MRSTFLASMHSEAWDWIARYGTYEPISVLDIGSRITTHNPRELFPFAEYTGLDICPGDGVDIIADAAVWNPRGKRWDIVLAAEVFEHTPTWRAICHTAWLALRTGGMFIVTTAAPGRPPHSAVDGQAIRDGEYYRNIVPENLRAVLERIGFSGIVVNELPQTRDVRAIALKGG